MYGSWNIAFPAMWNVIGRLRASSPMSGQTNLEYTNPYLY